MGVKHFPWQRLTMMLVTIGVMLLTMWQYVGWIYYFATIDPTMTSPAVQTASITAISAAAGVLLVCLSAVLMWFITGQTRTLETMFKFNASTAAQTALSAAAQVSESKHTEVIIDESAKNENLRHHREDED